MNYHPVINKELILILLSSLLVVLKMTIPDERVNEANLSIYLDVYINEKIF